MTALAHALTHLGISPVYHMAEVQRNTHALLWCRAIEAKSDPNTPSWDRFKFDQLLSGHQAVGDYPASIFAEDPAEAYPSAAIILTTRSEDSWVASMGETLVRAQEQRSPQDQAPMASLARAYHKHCWDNDFEKHGRKLYREHNAAVRKLAEGRKFLEYQPEEEWGPLCDFLGLEVPQATPYSLVDDWAE